MQERGGKKYVYKSPLRNHSDVWDLFRMTFIFYVFMSRKFMQINEVEFIIINK